MKSRIVTFVAVVGSAVLALAGAVGAQVVVQPSPPASQVVQAGDIEAKDVRAQTIYANKIKASQINGAIHQTKDVKMNGGSNLKVPSVVASVIYAETIEARTVTADNIYVREIERK